MIAICCHLERYTKKKLKLYVIVSSYFDASLSLFQVSPCNKGRPLELSLKLTLYKK